MPYLFAYFIGEKPQGEQIYFSLSEDGLHWQDQSEQPMLQWRQGDSGVRDPYIVKHPLTGEYFIMATDLCIHQRAHDWEGAIRRGSRDIVLWRSKDLIHWSEPWAVTFAPEGAGCAWAPEAIWDEEKQDFLVYASCFTDEDGEAKHRMYAAHTADFVSFTPVFRYMDWPDHVIDTTIIKDGGIYYRFSASHDIKIDAGSSLLGEFTRVHIPAVESLVGVEGPECYRLPDGRICFIADRIREYKGYVPVIIDDAATGQARVLDDTEFDFDRQLKRHGGVVAISQADYERVKGL